MRSSKRDLLFSRIRVLAAQQIASVSVSFSQNLEDRPDQDQQVKPEAPIVNVPQIELHALRNVFDRRRGTTGPIALRPARYAGLDVMAKGIVAQHDFKVVVVGQGVRTRPNQGHVTRQNIPKLRQLVDTSRPKQPANTCYSRVVTRRLHNVGTVFLDGHGSKLQYSEMLPVKAFSDLSENDRTRAVQFDSNGRKGHDRQEEYQHE